MDWRETLKCRACLAEDAALIPLFEVYEHNLTLADVLQNCINAEVGRIRPFQPHSVQQKPLQVRDDGLPRYLCENCVTVVTEFYNFSVIYEENVSQLNALLENKDVPLQREDDPDFVRYEYGPF